jgi:hypothetical protein
MASGSASASFFGADFCPPLCSDRKQVKLEENQNETEIESFSPFVVRYSLQIRSKI